MNGIDALHSRVQWHALSVEEGLRRAESTVDGLADGEAQARLTRYGPNVLSITPPVPWWIILAGQFKSVLALLLIAAAALGILIGDPEDAVAIVAVLVLNVVLGFVIEFRARRAVEALS